MSFSSKPLPSTAIISALAYAREHGLAVDHRSKECEEQAHRLLELNAESTDKRLGSEDINNFDVTSGLTEMKCTSLIFDSGEFQLPENASHVLDDYIAKPTITTDEIYNSNLPEHRRLRNIKLELPMLLKGGGSAQKDVWRVRQGIDFNQAIEDARSYLEESFKQNYVDSTIIMNNYNGDVKTACKIKEGHAMPEKFQVSRMVMTSLSECLSNSIEAKDLQEAFERDLPKIPRPLNYQLSESLLVSDHLLDSDSRKEDGMNLPSEGEPAGTPQDIVVEGQNRYHDATILVQRATEIDQEQTNRQQSDLAAERKNDAHHVKHLNGQKQNDIAGCHEKIESIPTEKHIVQQSMLRIDDQLLLSQVKPPQEAPSQQHHVLPSLDNEITSKPTISPCCPRSGLEVEVLCSPLKSVASIEMVDVPIMEWDFSNRQPSTEDLVRVAETYFPTRVCSSDNDPKWMGRIVSPVSPDESILDKGLDGPSNEQMLIRPVKIVSSAQLLWKEPGLRILREIDESDLVSIDNLPSAGVHEFPSCSKDENDPCSPAAGDVSDEAYSDAASQLNHQASSNPSKSDERVFATVDVVSVPQPSKKKQNQNSHSSQTILSCLPELKNGDTTTSRKLPSVTSSTSYNNSLRSFLDLRGVKFERPSQQIQLNSVEIPQDPIELTQSEPIAIPGIEGGRSPDSSTSETHLLLQVSPLDHPRAIVMYSFLIKTRPSLLQFLEAMGGTLLNIICREMSSSTVDLPDIIINPSSCLILGHIQAITQRPLPGQTHQGDLSWLHQRVNSLARQYQQVFVLLQCTHGSLAETQSSCHTLMSKFSGYCSQLSVSTQFLVRSVRPIWITSMRGTCVSEVVNSWVWKVIEKQGFRAEMINDQQQNIIDSMIFIHDETVWELFLVKAGLNPLAAQVMLSMLKGMERLKNNNTSSTVSGLSQLLQMSSYERSQTFSEILGSAIIEKLNLVLENKM